MSTTPATANPHGDHIHGEDDHNHGHPAHLAHHFETPAQQFASGKLGMWVFLGTEILMFGGLFCAYAVYRYNHPEVFEYASEFLDKKWGAINTVVLLASSLTMAWGVRAAQLGQQALLKVLLVLTLLGGFGFMGIKSVEYSAKWKHHIWFGAASNVYSADRLKIESSATGDAPTPDTADEAPPPADTSGQPGADHADASANQPAHGEGDASASHGAASALHDATPGSQGDTSASHESATGGAESGEHHYENPSELLKEENARRYMDPVNHPAASFSGTPSDYSVEYIDPRQGTADATSVRDRFLTSPGVIEPHENHRPTTYLQLSTPDRERTFAFFSVYFMMTGLHGVHVLVGMGLITWILIRSFSGEFSGAYYTPVDLVGLYWHLVDLIWIFLFPLLYLIH